MDKTSYIKRAFDLARLGISGAPPNPLVGAVLVYEDTIIGEGYHSRFGSHHAEVAALRSVPKALRSLIPKSKLYVSLEPCCITGKTAACTDLI
ncbi:MAG TPA: riboflavin biosynthesis protein RibD, partial [Phaeodactylibacter sp.]|nr:riboflavin biosynthesis protein RibD [Phaeodactylibacter sp.]